MNILTLFNGIGGLPLSCERADIKVDKCYYSEIDKFANKVMEHHYPNAIALGDVTKWREWDIDWASIELVGAGFPCQSWSVAGQQLGDKDERGMLFWTTLEIIKHVLYFNPKAKFLMENVKMKKDFEEYITHHTEQALGYVEKTLINSALVSAQNRQRYYWTNFKVTQPEDKGILLKDIIDGEPEYLYSDLENDIRAGIVSSEQNLNGASQSMHRALSNGKNPDQKANTLTACADRGMQTNGMTNILIQTGAIKCGGQGNRIYSEMGKSPTLSAQSGGTAGAGSHLIGEVYRFRKLTPLECERLQTLPDNWTSILSNTQRYKSIGNGWTIDVIAHILKHI